MSNIMSIENWEFLKPIQKNWRRILTEYISIHDQTQDWFQPELYSGTWKTFGLVYNREFLNEKLCPFTSGLLREIPSVFIAGFSILDPHTVIHPHIGFTDKVLRSHLGLICPQGPTPPWLKVGDDTTGWRDGEMFVFNDTLLHSAENPTDKQRVVLILDFYK